MSEGQEVVKMMVFVGYVVLCLVILVFGFCESF